jgi:hypothetical protein
MVRGFNNSSSAFLQTHGNLVVSFCAVCVIKLQQAKRNSRNSLLYTRTSQYTKRGNSINYIINTSKYNEVFFLPFAFRLVPSGLGPGW